LVSLLEFISLGKHNSGLFYRGRIFYSTWQGGIVTLIFSAIVIALGVITIQGVIRQDNVNTRVQTTTEEFEKYNVSIYGTIGQLELEILVTTSEKDESGQLLPLSCEDIAFTA